MSWIRTNLLREEVIVGALHELRQRFAERAQTASIEAPTLTQEADKLRAEIERLSEAIMSTTDAPTTRVRMLKEREKRLATVADKLAAQRAGNVHANEPTGCAEGAGSACRGAASVHACRND